MMNELINTYLGPYRLIEVSGNGGMATVYKAYQPSLDRYVAIKVLPRMQDPLFVARFKREARALAQMQHPNILPVYDYGEQGDLLYLVLQYIENGTTLGDMLGTPMEPTRALRIVGGVLDALDYAHARGVIHRDIKPSNILMPAPTWPLLADFGIAQLLDTSQRLTVSGMIIGTVAYMAPEQASSATVDARADLYATGVVLYEMLTGQVPFDADTPMAMLMKHAYEAPISPRRRNPSLSLALEASVLYALAKDPAARYQSASEMAEALERAATQIEHPPQPVTPLLHPAVPPEASQSAASDIAPAPDPVDTTAPSQAHTLPRSISPRVWFVMGGMAVLLALILALVFIDESIGSAPLVRPSAEPATVAVQAMIIATQTPTMGESATESSTATVAAVLTPGAASIIGATPTETVLPTPTPTPVPPSAIPTNTILPTPTQTPKLRPTTIPQRNSPTPLPTATLPPPPTATLPPPTAIPSSLVARMVHPAPDEYQPAATTELIFQVEAYDQTKGTNDGDGIANVDMDIYDSNGVQVYHRTETQAHYCAFSGDNGGPCPALNFAKCNNTWATTNCQRKSGKIVSGDYMLKAIVHAQDGRTITAEGHLKVQLASP